MKSICVYLSIHFVIKVCCDICKKLLSSSHTNYKRAQKTTK